MSPFLETTLRQLVPCKACPVNKGLESAGMAVRKDILMFKVSHDVRMLANTKDQ